jgi:hypothetical protein
MKKARILLAAVAVFAIVGGTMAAKAKRGSQIIYTGTTTIPSLCTFPTVATTLPDATPLKTVYARTTTLATVPCVYRTIFLGN